jgi:uncharacterized membrane protein
VSYLLLKYLHIVSATVIFGTGTGIAFFMVMAHRTRNPVVVAHTARAVVIADVVFTASAVVLQPVTGYFLTRLSGRAMTESWIVVSLSLYLIAGCFWLPVLWMQARMRDFAIAAANTDEELPAAYHRLFRVWFAFGFPSFGAVLAIFALMIFQPVLF